jgi:hypothetical protein
VRMDFDVTGVQKTERASGLCLEALEQLQPYTVLTPTSVILIDRIPGSPRPIDRPPTAAFGEYEKNALENEFYGQRRSSPLRLLLGVMAINVLWKL